MVQSCLASVGVIAELFTLVRYQAAYAARQAQLEGMTIHRLLVKISNIFFTICIHVVHVYNMSVFRHINLRSMSYYDINVSSCLQVC